MPARLQHGQATREHLATAPMKYRHSFHAGNFADVHKHVTLLRAAARR